MLMCIQNSFTPQIKIDIYAASGDGGNGGKTCVRARTTAKKCIPGFLFSFPISTRLVEFVKRLVYLMREKERRNMLDCYLGLTNNSNLGICYYRWKIQEENFDAAVDYR